MDIKLYNIAGDLERKTNGFIAQTHIPNNMPTIVLLAQDLGNFGRRLKRDE